jgi:gliding motility-associated-like protein
LNGCTSNAQIVITQDIALPVISISATPSSILTCSQNTINLLASGGATYSWSNGTSIVSSSSSLSVNAPANYTVTVKGNNGCENNSSITVTQNTNLPDANVSNNGTICKGDNAVFIITGTPGSVVNYSLNNSANQNITLNAVGTAQINIALPTTDQVIQLNSVSLNACVKNLNINSTIAVDNFSINLNVNPLSTNPGNDISAQITSNGTIVTSSWSPINLFNQNVSSQTISAPDQTFQIEVTATSSNGCVANQSQIVEIISSNNIYYVPNSFIPGSSGNSDINTLKLYGTSIKKATMQVFNQWGQCIFESENPLVKGWDGRYKGVLQPTGVYVYTVKIIFNDKKTVVKSGSINLIR